MEEIKFKVCVSCMTYNHSAFIEDAMNGFCMQRTNFPFVCTIVDDASTDSEQEVIKNYLQNNFLLEDKNNSRFEETNDYSLIFSRHRSNPNCFFSVIFLKENHYQKRKSKRRYLWEWISNVKYISLCEGDDYWIATDKLQCQVDYLDNHPDYTMVCNRAKIYSEYHKKFVGEHYCYDQSQTADTKDIIRRTGLFIPTCSITYRREIGDNKPDYWLQCSVGDYPLQIMCAMKGKVFYFDNIMSVYRRGNPSAWTGQQRFGTCSRQRLEVIMSQVLMFEGFGKDFPEYNKIFQDKIFDHINRNIPSRHFISKKELDFYLDFFSNIIKKYSFRGKIDLLIRKSRIPGLRFLYKPFTEKYSRRFLKYKY